MLNQSIPVEQLVFKASAYIAERKLDRDEYSEHDLKVVFDLLQKTELADNAIAMLYPDRIDELNLFGRNRVLCQVCQEMATGMVRTKGGRLLLTCKEHSIALQQVGSILLLGDEVVEEDPDLIQALRTELIVQEG